MCRVELGNFADAISDFRRARQLCRDRGDDEGYARATEALAAAHDYAEQHADAEQLFRELVERARTLHGASSEEHGRALSQLGINLDMQDRCRDAVPVLEQATGILLRVAPDEPALDSGWNALGSCAQRARDLEKALGYYERSLELRSRTAGPEHPRTAIVRHNLAVVLSELERRPEALEHARAAVRIRAAELPADHPWRRESEALYVGLGGTLPPDTATPR